MDNSLTEQQIEMIEKNEWVIFSTVDKENYPRAIIVQPSIIENNRIILSNIQMGKSFENIIYNNKCFINVYCKENDDTQIKITGRANIFENGELYNKVKEYEETNNLPDDLKVNSIIVVNIENIEITNG